MANARTVREILVTTLMDGYLSSQSQITESVIEAYVNAIMDCEVEALKESCSRFAKGAVEGRNNSFMPSAAEIAAETRRVQERMDIEAFHERTTFVEFDTPEWRALCQVRGRSMPQVKHGSVEGWWVPKDELAALPEQIVNEHRVGGIDRVVALPSLKRI